VISKSTAYLQRAKEKKENLLLWVESLLPALLAREAEEEAPSSSSPASIRLLVMQGLSALHNIFTLIFCLKTKYHCSVLRIRDVYPGSAFSIPNPHFPFRIRIKVLKYI
jgi:hypothetical protein